MTPLDEALRDVTDVRVLLVDELAL